MNHLNVFNPYRNKSNYHEDELTRAFLILLKKIPMIQGMFIDLIRNEMIEKKCNDIIPSLFQKEAYIYSVNTQISNSNEIFKQAIGRRVVSIVISDDRLIQDTEIKNSSRKARYDCVILYEPSWIFVIENKPSVKSIWLEQLNPNVDESIEIEENIITLSWREIIEKLNSLVENKLLMGLEEDYIIDFIEYIDYEFPKLNPYTTLAMCKDNEYLITKRCISIMEGINLGKVEKHRGWKYFIRVNDDVTQKITVYPTKRDNDWYITLDISAGPIMSKARNYYRKLNISKLKSLNNNMWNLIPDLHFSFKSDNLVWTTVNCDALDYAKYWKNNIEDLKQVDKDKLEDYQKNLLKEEMSIKEDLNKICDKILSKAYKAVNVCPSLSYRYIWNKDEAITLDREGRLINEVKEKIKEAMDTWK